MCCVEIHATCPVRLQCFYFESTSEIVKLYTSPKNLTPQKWPPLCSYLLAVGLECGRILLYTWRPGQQTGDGHDWRGCGETDVSYLFQENRAGTEGLEF